MMNRAEQNWPTETAVEIPTEQPTAKTMRVKMVDPKTNEVYFWTVRRHTATCVGMFGRKTHKETGWLFTSHDGCERFSEGAWRDLLPMFHLVADNYGLTCNLS